MCAERAITTDASRFERSIAARIGIKVLYRGVIITPELAALRAPHTILPFEDGMCALHWWRVEANDLPNDVGQHGLDIEVVRFSLVVG